jgi:hypothetical protein
MPFDINPQGSITITPLISYETAVVADVGCAMRLILARPTDPLGTGSIVVQTAMTVEQAEELVLDIQKMIDHIRRAQETARH